mmetsp:Transcript_4111/g.13504  ORF Transcript_4111/g.13504 Transcript_4111/m.13504 type:complete len:157 (-) Transcript_4111:545-1015(-)
MSIGFAQTRRATRMATGPAIKFPVGDFRLVPARNLLRFPSSLGNKSEEDPTTVTTSSGEKEKNPSIRKKSFHHQKNTTLGIINQSASRARPHNTLAGAEGLGVDVIADVDEVARVGLVRASLAEPPPQGRIPRRVEDGVVLGTLEVALLVELLELP